MEKEKDVFLTSKSRTIIIILFFLLMSIIIIINIIENRKVQIKELEILQQEEIEQERQQNLRTCYRTAESDRKSLWKANCPDDNPNCSLNQSTIKWIDSRYEQDIENCNSLYK